MITKFKLRKSEIPKISKLVHILSSADFIESFHSQVETFGAIDATFAFKQLFESPPGFVFVIMKIRDFIFRVFGLKNTKFASPVDFVDVPVSRQEPITSDMVLGFQSPEEVVWGIRDRHLDFGISVFVQCHENEAGNFDSHIFLSTAVKYKNTFGRVYFTLIRGIHTVVVKAMMRTMLDTMAETHKAGRK